MKKNWDWQVQEERQWYQCTGSEGNFGTFFLWQKRLFNKYGLCSEIAILEALLRSQLLGKKWRVESWTLDFERMFISYFCMMGKGLALDKRGRKRTEAFYRILRACSCLCTLVFVYILRTFDLQRMFISYFCMMGKGWALGREGRKRTDAWSSWFSKI